MDVNKTNETLYFRDLPRARKYWGWFLTMGLLLVILGALAVIYAGLTTLFTVIFLGAVLTAGGIMEIVNSFYIKRWSGFSVSILLGLLYIIAGFLCIFRPLQSAESLTLLIALLLLVGGSFRFFSALFHRFDYWGWVLFSGLVSVLFGLFILFEWPISGLWLIGLYVGIDLMMIGWTWVMLSIAASRNKQ